MTGHNQIRIALPWEHTEFRLGGKYPEELPCNAEGGTIKLEEHSGMWLLQLLKTPMPREVNAFNCGTIQFGLLAAGTFPLGLLLVRWRISNGKWMHQEFALSIHKEAIVRPEACIEWLAAKSNTVQLVQIDADTNYITGLRALILPPLLCQRLADVWKAQLAKGVTGEVYDRAYADLCNNYPTEWLWNRAEVYNFVPHG